MSNLSMLVYICESMKLHDVAEYWQSVITLNEYQQRRFVNTIVETMVNVKGKKIALLGFAYKPDTSDCRQSPAIDIAHAMLAEGARLSICDPQVPPESITAALGDHSSLQVGHLFAHAACALPLPVRPSGCWRGCPHLLALLGAAAMNRCACAFAATGLTTTPSLLTVSGVTQLDWDILRAGHNQQQRDAGS